MKKSLVTLALAAALPLSSAHAELTFNGFANIVAGKASSGDTQWGYDDDVDFKEDSLFALQTSADLGDGLSVTAQIIARGEDDWETDFEWAYLSYSLNDQTTVMVGRQRAPLFMYSEYLDVSYAMPWITVPEGLYATEFSSYDGISVRHNFALGEFESSIQVIGGAETTEMNIAGDDIDVDFNNMYGANLTLTRDWFTLHTAFLSAKVTVPNSRADGLGNAWLATPEFEFVADQITVEDDTMDFAEVGIQIDYNNWLVIAEYSRQNYETMTIDNEEAMYATIGYRFDDILVHATYGMVENDVNPVINQLPQATTESLAAQVDLTRQFLNFRMQDNTYYTIGARWDFHESAAFKVEFSAQDNELTNEDTSLVRTALVTVF